MKKNILIFIFTIAQLFTLAQGDDGWNNRVIPLFDNVTEVARVSLTFAPGFETTGHPDFLGYIDPDLPMDGGVPVSDGDFNLNFIRVFEPIKNNSTSNIPIHNSVDLENDWSERITYYDGLGREIQQTLVKGSTYGNDVIVPIKYDDFGRNTINYLPYAIAQDGANGAGGYRPFPVNEIETYYSSFYGDVDGAYAYTDKIYDNSPLNRVKEQSAPGNDWRLSSNHHTEFTYGTNTENNEVYLFSVSESNQLVKEGCYPKQSLFKNTYKDENNSTTIEYKDYKDRLVSKVVNSDVEPLITQYVYDKYNNLRFVLPPEAFSKVPPGSTSQAYENTIDWIKQLCYYYKYDVYGRIAIKKLPGADEVYMVYNRRDEVVLTQDGELRTNNDWLYIKYDRFNRPIISGKYHHSSLVSQSDMQTTASTETNRIFESYISGNGYSNIAFPVTSGTDEIYSTSYYDNYQALELETTPEDYAFISDDLPFYFLYNNSNSNKIKGLSTITKTKVLLHDGLSVLNEWLVSVTYYDSLNRAIQTISNNHLGGKNIVSSLINFTGEVEETKEYSDINTNSNTIYQKFTYNHAGQLTETLHKINNQEWVVLNDNKYNETGLPTRKQIHKTEYSFLQTVNYKYNIRSWLTDINDIANPDDDLFAMTLNYNNSANSAQYNGNIGTIKWNSAVFTDIMQYDYSYDGANRLLSSSFTGNGDYSTNYSYYKNGNIKTLTRNGEIENGRFGVIDYLTYGYIGNQLKYVNDGTTSEQQENGFTDNGSFLTTNEYFYDLNGNLKKDFNKQIVDEIGYNYMNLPQHIPFFNDENKYIDYIYNANGQKLQKVVSNNRGNGLTTDYIGSFVYKDNEPDFIFTPEGRIVPNGDGSFSYEYYLVDHLGNTRVSFSQTGEVLQDNSYYPFGMSMGDALSFQSNLAKDNKYLYNGKEFQDDFGLGWYDYGARFYDPAIGRFHTHDAFAEKYLDFSPYHYGSNNPISNIDINGDSTWVTTTNESITVHTTIEFTGNALYKKDGTLKKNAQKKIDAVKEDIKSGWDGIEVDGKEVEVDLITKTSSEGGTEKSYDQIELLSGGGQSKVIIKDENGNIIGRNQGLQYMRDLTNGKAQDFNVSGFFYMNSPSGSYAHEYGHIAGYLYEEYVIDSKGKPVLNMIGGRTPVNDLLSKSIMFSPSGNNKGMAHHIRKIMDVNKCNSK